jgi:hypothetical protein
MVNININVERSRDGKYVMLSADDWKKVLSALSHVAVINDRSAQQGVEPTISKRGESMGGHLRKSFTRRSK